MRVVWIGGVVLISKRLGLDSKDGETNLVEENKEKGKCYLGVKNCTIVSTKTVKGK